MSENTVKETGVISVNEAGKGVTPQDGVENKLPKGKVPSRPFEGEIPVTNNPPKTGPDGKIDLGHYKGPNVNRDSYYSDQGEHDIRVNMPFQAKIGRTLYRFLPSKIYTVPGNVKEILRNAGRLSVV